MALAIHLLLRDGMAKYWADLARLGGVTRARTANPILFGPLVGEIAGRGNRGRSERHLVPDFLRRSEFTRGDRQYAEKIEEWPAQDLQVGGVSLSATVLLRKVNPRYPE